MEGDRRRFLRGWLPYLSVALLVAMLVTGVVAGTQLVRYKQIESPDARPEVEALLEQFGASLRAGEPADVQSERFRLLLGPGTRVRVGESGTIQVGPGSRLVLVLDEQGRVLYNNTPRKSPDVGGLTTGHLQRVLAALPPDALSTGQRLLLQVSDALQAEGEHADIYGYAARVFVDPEGKPVRAVAVAYNRTTGTVPPLYTAALLLSLATLGLYWLSLPLWVYLDARARGERAWLWAALALGGNVLGVVTYLLARRTNRANCPGCGAVVDARNNVCPACGQRVRPACASCHEPLREGWRYCPRCAASVR